MSDTTLDTKGLDSLLKALKGSLPHVRIGVLAGGALRKNAKGSNNASIGATHEFGSDKMPMRSFLRMPLTDHLQKEMESSGALDVDVLRQVLKQGSVLPWLMKIQVLAEKIVAVGFESGGYGKWAPWKNPHYKNGNMRILDDTGQLKDSITSEIV